MSLERKYFDLWAQFVTYRKYDKWCEENYEEMVDSNYSYYYQELYYDQNDEY